MKAHIWIIAPFMVFMASCATDRSFTSVQQEFEKKVLTLVSESGNIEKDTEELSDSIVRFSRETFGNHLAVVRKEGLKRYNQLPVFNTDELDKYIVYKTYDESEFAVSDSEFEQYMILVGWDIGRSSAALKNQILSSHLGLPEYHKRIIINQWVTDKAYRLGTGKNKKFVVVSLNDLFLINLAFDKQFLLKPVSAQWMKRKTEAIAP